MLPNNKKKILTDIVIGFQLLIYIVLTTMIFINHKKIQVLKRETTLLDQNQENTKLIDRQKGNDQKYLAQKSYKQGKFSATVSSYEKIIRKTPNDWDARFKLGVMLYSKQDKRALKHLNYILQKNPSYVHNTSIRSWIKNLEKADSTEEKKPEEVYLTSSQKKALQQLKKMLDKNPNHPNKKNILETIEKWEKWEK